MKGRPLWSMGSTVLQSIKKALSIVPKLLPRIVIIDKNCAVVGYASGKNKSLFMQHIDNGLFALMTNEGGTLLVEDASDNDDKILGATSEEGMPMMCDNALIDSIRVTAADALSNDTSFDDVVVVDSMALNTWDPFGGIAAPRGYTYIGKLALICFGPVSKFFASTLAMGGQSERSTEEKKEGLMRAIHKITKEQTDINQEIGINRGMTMQARMQCAFMAQNKDDAIQQHRDMQMVMLTKQTESTERLIELKIETSDRMGGGGLEANCFMAIHTLMDKLEKLNTDLDSMMLDVRATNSIVGNVLANAAKAMGLDGAAKVMSMPKHNEDDKDDGEVIKDLLMDG
jgi:hypothetical protein